MLRIILTAGESTQVLSGSAAFAEVTVDNVDSPKEDAVSL